jgi:hypothetical protein
MSELTVLDRTGDTRFQWDQRNADEVKAAREHFETFKKKGYAAFKVNKAGGEGEQIHAFDPKAERVIMPPLVGG